MKKIYTSVTIFLAFLLLFAGKSTAQCTPDASITSPGFAPNPLPDGCVGTAYSEVVSFLFPNDTTISVPPFGNLTIPFDSFVVSSVFNIPAGLTYACNVGGSCTYVTAPPAETRGCVTVSGTPTTANTTLDSIGVVGQAWVTILGSPSAFADTIKIALLVNPCGAGIFDAANPSFALTVSPNPATGTSSIRFDLDRNEMINVSILDMMGRTVMTYGSNRRFAGSNEITLDGAASLPAGIYSVKVETADHQRAASTKLIVVQ
jgi:Secretion system C-terminal sorting domain